MYKIEKGVPLPKTGDKSKYPFKEMEVGDSVFISDKTPEQLGGSMGSARKATGFRFTARRENGGARVWRFE